MLQQIHGIEVRLDLDAGGGSADEARDAEILRIAEEALHNAVRHSAAGSVSVRLRARDGAVTVEVADDGRGFDPADRELRSRHLGLTSMEERAQDLGGRLALVSRPGAGTVVTLEVPRRGR